MLLGASLSVFACCLMLGGAHIWPHSVMALMLPMMFYSTGLGLVLPHAMAIALRPFAHIAGTASALLGFIQMSLSASASALAGVFLKTPHCPCSGQCCVITLLALALTVRAQDYIRRSKP